MAGIWLAATACAAETPPNEMSAPDPAKIIVFFPIDGEVRGRGSPGAAPAGADHVYVASHPSPGHQIFGVNEDGSFAFNVSAGSSDVLEFAGSKDPEAMVRGEPTYIQVPFARTFEEDFYCCVNPGARQGRCVRVSDEAPVCSEDPIFRCQGDADCAVHSQRLIDFLPDAVQVDPPDVTGRISVRGVEGKLPPLSLIQVENRGQRAIGHRDPRFRTAVVTDERGVFEIGFPANGDDELVFQIYEFDGVRSQYHAVRVPDSKLAGADIVGVFPFDLLAPQQTGSVAIRVAPFGEDANGICPNSTIDPVLCFGGGLDYSMVTIDQMSIDGVEIAGQVRPSQITPELPATRATDGNVVEGPQVLMLILDTSFASRSADPEGIRFRVATDFVNALRARDLLGIISVGGISDDSKTEVSPTNNKQALLDTITALEARNPIEGGRHDIYGAIATASQLIQAQTTINRGQMLIVTSEIPAGKREEADKALNHVLADPDSFFDGFPTYVVGVNLLARGCVTTCAGMSTPDDKCLECRANATSLRDIAAFSKGEFVDVLEPRGLIQTVARITGVISGAFVLLYDVPIPGGTGKAADVSIRASLNLPPGPDGEPQTATAEFSGILEVRGGL